MGENLESEAGGLVSEHGPHALNLVITSDHKLICTDILSNSPHTLKIFNHFQ